MARHSRPSSARWSDAGRSIRRRSHGDDDSEGRVTVSILVRRWKADATGPCHGARPSARRAPVAGGWAAPTAADEGGGWGDRAGRGAVPEGQPCGQEERAPGDGDAQPEPPSAGRPDPEVDRQSSGHGRTFPSSVGLLASHPLACPPGKLNGFRPRPRRAASTRISRGTAMQIVEPTESTTTAIEPDPAPGGRDRRLLLVRLAGEMGVKSSRTRRSFLRLLAENARRALRQAGVEARVRPEWSRLLVETADPEAARETLGRVFGVHAVAEVVEVAHAGLEDLVARLLPLFQPRVEGRTFAVRPRRTPETPFTSEALARALGAALLPHAAKVDLSHPEVEVRVRAEPGRAFAEMESGCGQVDAALAAARELVRRWAPGHRVPAHVVDLAPMVAALVDRVPGRMRQVLLKRAMYRVGDALAREIGAEALVTGECLGQVSTQTLRNLATCEEASSLPVLRPLIGLDKNEIMERARRLGTYEASSQVREHCSIAEGQVVTRASAAAAEAAERLLPDDLASEAWARAAVAARTVVPSLADWRPAALPEHVVDRVPEGAVVVDVREPGEGPTAGDLRLPFSCALDSLAELPPGRTYVLVCASGYRSDLLARELRGRGYAAFSLLGGVGRLGAPVGGREAAGDEPG